MTARTSAPAPDAPNHLPEPEPPAALVPGTTIQVTAKILRVRGPWVDVSVLGELQHVTRSRLEKELSDHG